MMETYYDPQAVAGSEFGCRSGNAFNGNLVTCYAKKNMKKKIKC